MTKKNPTLVFGETHDDPAVSRILSKLLVKLISLGYTHYFHEADSQSSVEKEINELDFLENIYQKLNSFFELNKLNIRSENDWEKGINEKLFDNKDLLNNLGLTQEQFKINAQTFWIYADCREGRQAYKLFLEKLAKEKIIYQGIDSDVTDHGLGGVDLDEFIQLTTKMRNKEMASWYASTEENIFGHGGVGHFPGIQKEILHKMSLKEAKDKFIFIYITSTSDPVFLYNDKKMHPLGSHYFDASKLSDDIIVQKILNLVAEKLDNKKQHTLPHLSVFSSSLHKLKDKLSKHHQEKDSHAIPEQTVPKHI